MPAEKSDILAQRPAHSRFAQRLAATLALVFLPPLAIVTAFGIAPDSAPVDVPRTVVREPIELPEMTPAMDGAPRFVSQERVLRGDTVAAVLDRLGVHDAKALGFMKADTTGHLIFRQLVPGRMVQAESSAEGELVALRYFVNVSSLLEITRTPEGFTARQRALDL